MKKNNTIYCDYFLDFCRKTTNFNKIMCKIRKIKKKEVIKMSKEVVKENEEVKNELVVTNNNLIGSDLSVFSADVKRVSSLDLTNEDDQIDLLNALQNCAV